MRKILLTAVLGLALGCRAKHGLPPDACMPASCPMPCPPQAASCPPSAPAPEVPRAAQPTQPRAAQPRQEAVEPRSAASIAQDVMLVPRVVYMPYVAQTPIAPVRVGGLVGAGIVGTERREFRGDLDDTSRAAPRSAEPRDADTMDRLEKLMRDMNRRMDQLEATRSRSIPSMQVPCPPGESFPVLPMPQPCPTPTIIQQSGSVLAPPR